MDKASLVSLDRDKGADVLRILDEAGLKVEVALWILINDYEDFRFLLAGRKLDEAGLSQALRLIDQALDRAGIPFMRRPLLLIWNMHDPFIRALRKTFAKAKSVEGMRLGGQTIGNRFLLDGYVYRIR
jgi:hypothetical protein